MPARRPTRKPRGEVSAILHATAFTDDGSLDPTNRHLLMRYYSGDTSRWAELRLKAERDKDRDSLLLLAGGLLVMNALIAEDQLSKEQSAQLGQELLRTRESIAALTPTEQPGQQG